VNRDFLTSTLNRKLEERFGSIEYEGKRYILTDEAAPTSRLLPDHQQQEYFELSAPAIDEEDNDYIVYWIFKADGRELDMYDYTDVNRIEAI
jgi:hypothetical protein